MRSTIVALALFLAPVAANAKDGQWKADHPRRAEVNQRLHNQNARIHEGVESGSLSKREAHRLHANDRAIRQEERAMAAQHGGHLTKDEQNQLNREENRNSRAIYQEKHE